MKVEMLNAGWFTTPAGIWRRGDALDQRVRYPVPAFMIETGEERILVDTGLNPAAIADPGSHYGKHDTLAMFELELDQSIADQVDLDTITKVVLTHLHFDHAGGLALLPSSVPIFIQRSEWEAGHDADAIEQNFYMPVDYEAVESQVTLVDGDHDLLGDGSIELLLTPGHTRGHQSVRVGERLVIAGDAIHYASGLDDLQFPVIADDHAEQRRSAERLREMRDSGATVIPGHDPEVVRPGPLAT